MFYDSCVRPLLFLLDPESIHHWSMSGLAAAGRSRAGLAVLRMVAGGDLPQSKPVEVAGLIFKHPVGLAAGFDKNAEALPAWEALGFSFVEAGTVTAQGQPGNDKPRIFRIPQQQALINRLGFNNDGAEVVAARLDALNQSGLWPSIPVGINIGKTKLTPLEKAAEDYVFSLRTLHPYADYFTINVSSPNTPGLRELQAKQALRELLQKIQEVNLGLTVQSGRDVPTPLFLKIAPDLDASQIDEILEIVDEFKITGIVATNTTVDKTPLHDARWHEEAGGLSGRPLADRSTEIIRLIARKTIGRLPIIGVGGVFTRDDVQRKLDAGATLVQIYTGFVYRGPRMIRSLLA